MIEFSMTVLMAMWGTLTEMSPYLLFGFASAGALSIFLSRETVETHLGGRGLMPVLKASLLGVPLPLCSCSVLPVAASLRKHGSSRGATVAFLLSTPQTGVDSILVTYSLLGPVFAVFRPIAAFVSGLLGGCIADGLAGRGQAVEAEAPACKDACCSERDRPGKIRRAMRHGFITLPGDIGRPIIGGILAAGLIAALVPDDFFAHWVGSGFSAMLLLMLLGIPVYVCATASVPIAAALIAKGVSPGAALVFLMTGPATNAAAISTVWRLLGSRTTLIYLGTVATTALVSGLALDGLLRGPAVVAVSTCGHSMPRWFGTASALVLLALFCYALVEPYVTKKKAGCCGHASGGTADASESGETKKQDGP